MKINADSVLANAPTLMNKMRINVVTVVLGMERLPTFIISNLNITLFWYNIIRFVLLYYIVRAILVHKCQLLQGGLLALDYMFNCPFVGQLTLSDRVKPPN